MQFIAMIALAFGCCVAANAAVNAAARKERRRALGLTALASACYVGVGAIGAAGCWYTRFGYLVLGGLCCGFVGDVLLGLRRVYPNRFGLFFGGGSAFFAVGHGLYIAALLSFTMKALYVAVPYAAAGLLLSALYLKRQKVRAGGCLPPGILSMALALFMAGCAAGCAVFAFSPGTVLFAIGGLFFAVSDGLLLADDFGAHRSDDRSRVLHILYYSAQIFFGFSLILLFVL